MIENNGRAAFAGSASANGRKGGKNSPWSRGPNCDTRKAWVSYKEIKRSQKAK